MSNVVEINDDAYKFKVKGKLITIEQATVGQEIAHQKKLKEITENGNDMEALYEANVNYLVDLGADENALRAVSRAGFMKILNTISGEASGK